MSQTCNNRDCIYYGEGKDPMCACAVIHEEEKVIPLFDYIKPPGLVEQKANLITLLEGLLADARGGKLIDIAVAGLDGRGFYLSSWTANGSPGISLLGAVHMLQTNLAHAILHTEDE